MLRLRTNKIVRAYNESYLKLFFDNIRTKNGRVNLSHFILGCLLEAVFRTKIGKKLIHKFLNKLYNAYIIRKEHSIKTKPECFKEGSCSDCSCLVPHMFWVKECKGECQI